jgi:hypothetical protein
MPFKKHVFLFLVFFITCSTSIRDQIGHEVAEARLAINKTVPTLQPLLAQIKVKP